MGCDRNWLKPLFTSIQNCINLYKTNDYTYFLPIPWNLKSKSSLNYITITLHTLILCICIYNAIYMNIFATNYLFPLYTISVYNELNIFIITLLLYVMLMFAVHISIMAPFLSPISKLKYTDRDYWYIITKSFVTKSLLFAILFSVAPLILLYVILFIFMVGNTPINYFKPNMQTFHSFHLFINHSVIPQLSTKFKNFKSNAWIQQFAYLLFNCAVLDEYISKKNAPPTPQNTHHRHRVSFVNILAGNDYNKVLNRVSSELENVLELFEKYGNYNKNILDCNLKSWNNNTYGYNKIKYNFQYLLFVLYPFHILLFWVYIIFNNNNKFNISVRSIVLIVIAQCLFCVISSLLLYIHLTFTVKTKPKLLYEWSNFYLMDFYCSFHDDDENDSFKTKIDSYINLFSNEYQTSLIIRKYIMFNQTWFADILISFCCVMDNQSYDEHSYNAIMNVISRSTRIKHIKQSSSKNSILRNSMHLHLENEMNNNKQKQSQSQYENIDEESNYSNVSPDINVENTMFNIKSIQINCIAEGDEKDNKYTPLSNINSTPDTVTRSEQEYPS